MKGEEKGKREPMCNGIYSGKVPELFDLGRGVIPQSGKSCCVVLVSYDHHRARASPQFPPR